MLAPSARALGQKVGPTSWMSAAGARTFLSNCPCVFLPSLSSSIYPPAFFKPFFRDACRAPWQHLFRNRCALLRGLGGSCRFSAKQDLVGVRPTLLPHVLERRRRWRRVAAGLPAPLQPLASVGGAPRRSVVLRARARRRRRACARCARASAGSRARIWVYSICAGRRLRHWSGQGRSHLPTPSRTRPHWAGTSAKLVRRELRAMRLAAERCVLEKTDLVEELREARKRIDSLQQEVASWEDQFQSQLGYGTDQR